MQLNHIYQGDALDILRTLPDASIHTCVTSPPYWGLRDYGVDGQIGLEQSPDEYVAHLVDVFTEVKRVLRDDGTLWLNLGDSYVGSSSEHKDGGSFGHNSIVSKKTQSGIPNAGRARRRDAMLKMGLKQKDLVGIPWRVAFALQQEGWYLRSDIVWHKPNAMPESVRDRPTKAHEYIFLLSKSDRYYYDHESVKEDATPHTKSNVRGTSDKQTDLGKRTYAGFNARYEPVEKRNKRSVWSVSTKPFKDAHFAVFPSDLIEPCILAGSPEGGVVLDPFMGAGTTGLVALNHNRKYIGIELNPAYIEIAQRRLSV